jgi:cellulose synthase/poly-beta-1,6-N-acetylglucosamine synthase-like glycosyltransferase
MVELFFLFSFVFILFTYIGYPVSIWFLNLFFEKSVRKTYWEEWPEVSVIVAAKNEEKNIHKRITNLVEQDYPKYKLEIIIVSDGSTDGTVRILQEIERELRSSPVSFETIVKQESSGKPSALNEGVMRAKGSILVFADVRQQFTATAIKELVANFSDTEIGCVSGELEFIEESNSNLKVEMGAYWKYEKAIRKMESSSASVVGATGAIYAIRKNLYIDLPAKILLDDVLTPINVASQGYRVIFDQTAKAYDTVSTNVANEWTRKVRTLAGNWQLLSHVALLSKKLSFRFLNRLFWHKLARLLIPYCLVVLLVTSIVSEGMVYKSFAGMQVTFYLLAILTHFFSRLRQLSLLKLCYFFCVLNVAAVVGFWICITGKSGDAWKPTASQGTKQ